MFEIGTFQEKKLYAENNYRKEDKRKAIQKTARHGHIDKRMPHVTLIVYCLMTKRTEYRYKYATLYQRYILI